jgi:hypothetical protein
MLIPFLALAAVLVIIALVFVFGAKKKKAGEDLGEKK